MVINDVSKIIALWSLVFGTAFKTFLTFFVVLLLLMDFFCCLLSTDVATLASIDCCFSHIYSFTVQSLEVVCTLCMLAEFTFYFISTLTMTNDGYFGIL